MSARKFSLSVLLMMAVLSVATSSKLFSQQSNDTTITIAFLLPFNANKVYVKDLQTADYFLPNETQVAVELYQGALLALDSLKNRGLVARVLVYDVGGDSTLVNAVLKKPELKSANLIIGPFSGYALKASMGFAYTEHIPFISPVNASTVPASLNQFVIIANATMKTHCEALADYLLQHSPASRTIMVYRKNAADLELVKYIKDYCDKRKEATSIGINFVELTDSTKTTYAKLRDSLYHAGDNVVVIPSNDEPFVRSVMKQVANLSSDFSIRVFGMPTWINFDLIPADNFDSTKTIITTSYWLDKSAEAATFFKDRYVKAYGTNPTEYAVRGYDEMYYFTSHLMKMGRLFLSTFPPSSGLTSATAYKVLPAMKQERDVMYRENKSVFFLQHENGIWMKK